MLNQGLIDTLQKAKNFSIIDDHSEAVFEDLVKMVQAKVAKLRKQQHEITGQLIQLSSFEQMFSSVLRYHCDMKKQAEVEEDSEVTRQKEIDKVADRQLSKIIEDHQFSDAKIDILLDISNDNGIHAALEKAREMADEIQTTPVQKNLHKKFDLTPGAKKVIDKLPPKESIAEPVEQPEKKPLKKKVNKRRR